MLNSLSLGDPTKKNGRLHDVLRRVKEKDIEILAVSELRWPGQRVSWLEESIILYSFATVSERECCSHGIVVIFSQRAVWPGEQPVQCLSKRIARVRLQLDTGYVTLFAVYTPKMSPE